MIATILYTRATISLFTRTFEKTLNLRSQNPSADKEAHERLNSILRPVAKRCSMISKRPRNFRHKDKKVPHTCLLKLADGLGKAKHKVVVTDTSAMTCVATMEMSICF